MKKVWVFIILIVFTNPCYAIQGVQISSDSDNATSVCLFENSVVWWSLEYHGIDDYKQNIYFYNDKTKDKIKLSSDGMELDSATAPKIHNDMVVWHAKGQRGERFNIFVYDGELYQFTHSSEEDNTEPCVYNDQIAWIKDGYVLMYWDKTGEIEITRDGGWKYSPDIYKGRIVWYGNNGHNEDDEIFYWDGTNVYQITDNDIDDQNPKIGNNIVTWEGHEGTDRDVYYCNLDDKIIHRLTETDDNLESPAVYENTIAWCDYRELFLYDVLTHQTKTYYLDQGGYELSLYDKKVVTRSAAQVYLYDLTDVDPLNNDQEEKADSGSGGGCFIFTSSQ